MTSKTFGLGDVDPSIIPMQRALNELLQIKLTADGAFGKITQDALGKFHASTDMVESDQRGVCYGPKTQEKLKDFIKAKYLEEADFAKAAFALEIDIAVVKAVTATEAKQFGFLPNGYPILLFERHKFYKALSRVRGVGAADKISAMNPDICNKTSGGYRGGESEIARLTKAVEIDPECAYLSASYGLFQIMGFNHKPCGYQDATSYFQAMGASERNQLNAFVSFVKADPVLHKALKNKDWVSFARAYNGPSYYLSVPAYNVRLEQNYKKALLD